MTKDESTQVPWPALILAVGAIAGGIFGLQSKLASSRPAADKAFEIPIRGLERIEARLWEDPFQKALDHLKEDGASTKSFDSESGLEQLRESIELDRKEPGGVLILPAILSAAPYAEDAERRRRGRYALLSGLYQTGYKPVDGEHIGMIKLNGKSKSGKESGNESKGAPNTRELAYPVPFERFTLLSAGTAKNKAEATKPPKNYGRVYVFWIADQMLGKKPITTLNRLFGSLGIVKKETSKRNPLLDLVNQLPFVPKKPELSDREGLESMRTLKEGLEISINGPAGSGTLARMLLESYLDGASFPVDENGNRSSMYSPWATTSWDALFEDVGKEQKLTFDQFKAEIDALKKIVAEFKANLRRKEMSRGLAEKEIALEKQTGELRELESELDEEERAGGKLRQLDQVLDGKLREAGTDTADREQLEGDKATLQADMQENNSLVSSLVGQIEEKRKSLESLKEQLDKEKANIFETEFEKLVNDSKKNVTKLFGQESDEQKAMAFKNEISEGSFDKQSLEVVADLFLGLNLIRTVHDDDELMVELVLELERRRIPMSQKGNHVVLISEWDTSYGRNLPRSFQKAVQARGWETGSIHEFSYERGLDGFLPGTDGEKVKKSSSKASEDYNQEWFDLSHQEKASGKSQFDYMRRLADQIHALDSGIQRNYQGRIRAIGILGSDVYDKLVVLRALRRRFPGVLFFTTDLDAIFLQREEIPWTRNLLVLSSYGLQLHQAHQRSIPPFRNTYQTAIFTSVLLAMGKLPGELISKKPAPRIFEIGKWGAHNLNEIPSKKERDQGKSLHPSRSDTWDGSRISHALIVIAIALVPLFAVMWHLGKKFTGTWAIKGNGNAVIENPFDIYLAGWKRVGSFLGHRKVSPSPLQFGTTNLTFMARAANIFPIALVVLLGLLAICMVVGYDGGLGEPLSLFGGISSWPTQIIRLVVFGLSIYYVLLAAIGLEKNQLQLGEDFSINCREGHVTEKLHQKAGEWQKTRTKVMLIIACVTILLLTLVYAMRQHLDAPSYVVGTVRIASIAVSVFALIFALGSVIRKNEFERIRESDVKKQDQQGHLAKRIWQRHLNGDSHYWGMKLVLCSAISYLCFGVILLQQLGFPHRPVRGWVTNFTDWFFFGLSLTGMLLLLIYVIWVSRRCIQLINDLAEGDTEWPEELYKNYFLDNEPAGLMGVHGECDPLGEWFDIKFIAARTKVVGTMIIFPFVVAFIYALSRNHSIDDWHWSVGSISLYIVSLTIALIFAYRVRTTAERARSIALDKLAEKQELLLAQSATVSPPQGIKEMRELVSSITKRIKDIQQGAFLPISRHPVLMAVLIPFGGYGSILFFEFMIASS